MLDSQQKELIARAAFEAQLIKHGFEVARAHRDKGIDLIVFLHEEGRPFVSRPIQLKASSGTRFAVTAGPTLRNRSNRSSSNIMKTAGAGFAANSKRNGAMRSDELLTQTAAEFFKRRAQGAKPADLLWFLDSAPAHAPVPGDEKN